MTDAAIRALPVRPELERLVSMVPVGRSKESAEIMQETAAEEDEVRMQKTASEFVPGASCHLASASAPVTMGALPGLAALSLEPQVVTMTASSLPELCAQSASSTARPRYVGCAGEVTNDHRRSLDLYLRGLSNMLCVPGSLESVLKSAGLLDNVESVHVTRKSTMVQRCAVIRAKTTKDLETLAKYFKGKHFGSPLPIVVDFAIGWRRDLTSKEVLQGSSRPRLEPLKVNVMSTRTASSLDHSCSTTSGSSTPSGSPRSSISSEAPAASCVILPPPGLEFYCR